MNYYRVVWPVLDEGLTFRELADEAREDFIGMATRVGLVVSGEIDIATTEVDGQLCLQAVAPVRSIGINLCPYCPSVMPVGRRTTCGRMKCVRAHERARYHARKQSAVAA